MKSFYFFLRYVLIVIFVFLFASVTDAGTRYKDIVFASVNVTKDVEFGSSKGINGADFPLLLNFYEPADDTLSLRPLVIFIHGGSLISSSRSEMDVYCTDFAKRGYTAATIEYRLGIESPKGVKTILEALLRGVQDTKAAVRFFRSKAGEYKIDTSNIYLEGSSAGSMIALHYAYWDQDEIPDDIDQAKWGDIEGTSGNPGYSSSIKGILNYCGAIVDPAWINEDIPVGNFHGLLDNIVPAVDGVSTDFGIRLFGGVTVSRITTELGIYNQGAFFPETGHGGNTDSLRVFSSNFFYSLMVLSSAVPQDFTSMQLPVNSLKVFRYDDYIFQATALDKSGNRIVLPSSMVEFSCDSKIGSITSTGIFTPIDNEDSGYVYAKFNNTTDECFVKVYDLKYFIIKPGSAVTDTIKTLQLSIDTYDADSKKIDLAISKFVLTSTNTDVGTVDEAGLFTGKMSGTTDIIAECSGFSDTCHISVEVSHGSVSFDALESLNDWTFTHSNLDTVIVTLANDQKSVGDASFKIEYKLTYDPQKSPYMIYLNKDLPVYGIPDSIFLDVKSDGRKHKLFYRFTDVNSGIYRASGKKFLSDSLKFDKIHSPLADGLVRVSGSSDLNYPITMNRIEIQVAPETVKDKVTSGTIYVDNLWLKYPGDVTGVDELVSSPEMFRLEQNYPNPFNAVTKIRYTVREVSDVEIIVFDLLGRRVSTIVNEVKQAGVHEVLFDASQLASGVYFYQMSAGGFVASRKFVLLK